MTRIMHTGIICAQLLRRPLRVIEAQEVRRTARDAVIEEAVVDSPRLLLVVRGRIDYVVEEVAFGVEAGEMLFVPALVRRRWSCERREGAAIWFVSFESDPPLRPEPLPLLARPRRAAVEKQAMGRVIQLARRREAALVCEGELKGTLARFLAVAGAAPGFIGRSGQAGRAPAKLQAAMSWLELHYAQRDAAKGLHERAGMSAWHFRRVFRELVGRTPTAYLNAQRMRAARYHLAEGGLSVKETAARVGIDDPLYLSRCYRRFWGQAPSEHCRTDVCN